MVFAGFTSPDDTTSDVLLCTVRKSPAPNCERPPIDVSEVSECRPAPVREGIRNGLGGGRSIKVLQRVTQQVH